MRPRTRKIEHAATPMPLAASTRTTAGGRVLRSHRTQGGQSNGSTNSANAAATKATTAKAPAYDGDGEGAKGLPDVAGDVDPGAAPMFRAAAEGGLEQVRRIVDGRKAGVAERIVRLKRQLASELLSALGALPEEVRKMTVKDFDAQFECDVVDMVTTRALEIYRGLEGGESRADPCPATIRREAWMGQRLGSKDSAFAAPSAAAGPPSMFETPAGKPSNAEFWSTAAKKKTGRGTAGGGSPDEKILTVSTKNGAILETCGIDLLTLAHDPDMAGALDVASIENIQKLHQLSSMILMHREKYNNQGIGLLAAVEEGDMDE